MWGCHGKRGSRGDGVGGDEERRGEGREKRRRSEGERYVTCALFSCMQTPIRTGREDQTRRWIDMSSVYDHVESSDSDIDPGISVHGSGSKDSNGSSSLVGNDAEDFNAIRCEREKVNQLVTECFRERREK